ncbi:MAG: DUF58 domain-containing protein [Uliginosibacterium sp.]|nr:DUF58 domain-containing protein [Uliginosibacterium sp.]
MSRKKQPVANVRPGWLRRQFLRWASRRAPEQQPILLRQSRVYVLPTGAGLALVATLGVMLLASINYNLSLGYGFTFLIAGSGLAHILYSWRSLVGLEAIVSADAEAFAGELAHFSVKLRNPHTRERPGLVMLDVHGQAQAGVDLQAHSSASLRLSIPATRRGRLRPDLIVLETRQPLGWIRAWAYLRPAVEQIVYPARDGTHPLPYGTGEGHEGEGPRVGGQDDFAGIRDFRSGDSLRHVAWKSLARGQGMLTKEFEGHSSLELVFDYASLPADMSLEDRLSQLTAWIDEARREGLRAALILPHAQYGPADSPEHFRECLRQLALFGTRDAHD